MEAEPAEGEEAATGGGVDEGSGGDGGGGEDRVQEPSCSRTEFDHTALHSAAGECADDALRQPRLYQGSQATALWEWTAIEARVTRH